MTMRSDFTFRRVFDVEAHRDEIRLCECPEQGAKTLESRFVRWIIAVALRWQRHQRFIIAVAQSEPLLEICEKLRICSRTPRVFLQSIGTIHRSGANRSGKAQVSQVDPELLGIVVGVMK